MSTVIGLENEIDQTHKYSGKKKQYMSSKKS